MSRPLLRALALSTALVWVGPVAAQVALAPIVAGQRIDEVAVARLHAEAVLGAGLPALYVRLDALATSAVTPRERAMARLVAAYLHWQSGERAAATTAVDAALALAPSHDALLLKAELLDADGRGAAAAEAYYRALADAPDATGRTRIELRLAMLAALRRPETLAAFAGRHSPAIAARAAIVLALLGRPKAALPLYRGGAGDVADDLRVAEWAIAADDTATARDRAWHATSIAREAGDRRYALALLVEAYRAAGDVKAAAAFLRDKPANAELVQSRLDLMLELGRTDEAVALIERSTEPAVRRRLTGVLDLAGRGAASEAEYRRLIAMDSHQPQWYAALAALYLARGDEARAVGVYEALFAANRGRDEVLTAGARQMVAMGLQAQAASLLTRTSGDPAMMAATHLFLFETYLDDGDTARAGGELEALRAGPRTPALTVDVADGYERLGRPAEALALLHGLEAQGVPLGYDQQVRIAELAARTGRQDEALTRWRALWTGTALPARRSYVERQIVRLAKQTGRIDALAREIDARLEAGTTRAGEIDLLVGLRLAQDDRTAAVAAVRRYAARSGAGEVATLRRLAALYARMRDQNALAGVLRRLIAIDPAQRDAHVRQYILASLEATSDGPPAVRRAELDRLMAQLADAGGGSAYQFRATVYAMASLDDQALAQLRAGVAARPSDADALLQLAAALKNQGHRDEAVAMLQFAARHGGDAVFATAIDGLIDQLVDAPADSGDPDAALAWAERAVLERMVTTGSDVRLLGLLGDIADARTDTDLQLRALEASLPEAADQRAAVLRQLVTTSGGARGDDGPAFGDPARKIIYGRRLLALGRSYPPDFYADLGRTMLRQGDVAGAERAFAMMGDLSGLVNVDALKGDAYAAEGRDAAALANYARALLSDQANLDLGIKTSILRERFGESALAQRWYWQALRGLLARQPLAATDASDDGRLDVRRFMPTLTEGLLLTWPQDAARAQAIRDDLARLFAEAAAQVDPARPGAYADRQRLRLLVDLGHRIADSRGDDGMTAGWDTTLDRLFAPDPAYRRAAALRRRLSGDAPVAVATDAEWPMTALRMQAEGDGNAGLLLALATAERDEPALRALTQAALADEVAWRAALAHGGQPEGMPPGFVPLLLDLLERMPADRFRTIVLTPLLASPVRDALLFDLFRALPDRYDRLEQLAGAPLLSPDALVAMTIARGNSPLGFSVRAVRSRPASDVWMDRFSQDQLLALYDGLVTRMTQGGGDSGLAEALLVRLLARPLDSARQARLAAIAERDIAFPRDAKARSVGPLLPRLLQLEVPAANRALLAWQAKAAADRYPDAARLPAFLDAWFSGDKTKAFELLLALGRDVSARYSDTGWIDGLVPRYFPEVRQREIAAFLADPHPDPAATARFHARYLVGENLPVDERLRYYRRLVALEPANVTYLTGLLTLTAAQEDWATFAPALAGYVVAHPDDAEAVTMLAVSWRLLDRPADAAAVAAKAGVDVDDAAWIVRMLARADAARSTPRGGMVGLFAPLYDAYHKRSPTAPVVVAVEVRRGASASRGGEAQPLRPLVDAARRDPAAASGVLRGLWRDTAAVPAEGDTDEPRATLAHALAFAGERADPVVLRADGIAEIEDWLRTLDPMARARRQELYDLVARGLIAGGQGTARMQAALAAMRGGAEGAHVVYLLAALADRGGAALAGADRALLVARLRAMPALAFDARLTMARVLARSGDAAAAAGLLRAALIQLLYPMTPLDTVEDQGAAATRLVAALAAWPDRAAAAATYADLSRVVADRKRGAGGTPIDALPPIDAPRPAG